MSNLKKRIETLEARLSSEETEARLSSDEYWTKFFDAPEEEQKKMKKPVLTMGMLIELCSEVA